jgi:protein-S-isoprenylcysteine O-methyltransferase Ste14
VFVAAIATVAATVASHQVPLALWHQENDAPRSLVTHGPYRLVRHPFYAAFLLMQFGSALLVPGVLTIGCLALGFASMTVTARREERRLLASGFGGDYAAYRARTGRFVPRFAAAAAAAGAPGSEVSSAR